MENGQDHPDERCANCGHARKHHIYHEGACRPGFVCAEGCTAFRAKLVRRPRRILRFRKPWVIS